MTMLTKEQVQTIMQANPNATTFEFPEGVTSIGTRAFYGYKGLTSIKIPKGVTSIGARAFRDCIDLTSIEIPEGVTSIERAAFLGCRSLETILIPEGVASIGEYAFLGCSSLESIVIPEGVTSIEGPAFCGCSRLESILIPDGVTRIGYGAFDGCSSLTSIELPKGLERIGRTAFSGCDQLSHIIAPEHLQEQLTEEYPDKTVMTLQQAIEEGRLDDTLVGKVQQHTQASLGVRDKQKLTEMVQTLSLASKASLMALKIPKDKTFNDISKTALVQCFGDAPASLLPLLGIEAKELAIKDNLDVGSLVESHLTVRDKLSLNAVEKGEVLTQPRPGTTLNSPTVRTSRVISLGVGQGLGDSDNAPDLSDQGSQERKIDKKPSSSTSRPRGHKS